MIKRTQLRQFMAVVDAGNFTRAAERLGVTQPTLSAGIAELERLAGTRLFVREKRRVRLTDAGNRLVAHARAIEREFRAAESSLALSEAPVEPLRLGVLPSLDTSALARLCRAYGEGRPLALVEGSDSELRRRLSEGRLDAALTLLRGEDPERGALALLDEPYVLMLPAGHPLAAREAVDPREVAGETMIARRSCEILGETSRFFTQRGVRPPFVLRSANDDRCMEMVRAGLGITTAPLSLLRDGIAAVRLEGYDLRRAIGLLGEEHAVLALEAAWRRSSAGE
jgi:DNA-binding transcriptional LysR family regulator